MQRTLHLHAPYAGVEVIDTVTAVYGECEQFLLPKLLPHPSAQKTKKPLIIKTLDAFGGEGGIRTLDTLLGRMLP